MKITYAIFDLLYVLAAAIVYVTAGSAAIYCASWLWGESVISKASSIAFGYFLFLHFFVLTIGVLRLTLQPRLREGIFPIGFNRDYMAWGINSVFHGIMMASPFYNQIGLIFYLNWLYYNLMGMTLPGSTMIGSGTQIRQPELMELGPGVVIGILNIISCHHSPNKKLHCHGKVIIGENTLVGGNSRLAAPITIGKNVVVGAFTEMLTNISIGDNAKIGAKCVLAPGASIPANVIIKTNSYITHDMDIQEGEIWAGNPAVCVGFINDSHKEKPHEKS